MVGASPCGCPGGGGLELHGLARRSHGKGRMNMGTKKYNADLSIRHKRKSLRLSTHNYGWSGTYFITIRSALHEPVFITPELHSILMEEWYALPSKYSGLTLDEFVIMADHIHFIIHLEGNVEKPATLSAVVGAYKSITTVRWLKHIKAAGLEYPGHIWQRNYYERGIRDAEELAQTRQYIRDNPIK